MAAGLGFKTFTTGEVLTAGDVNGYLMQGILVFATEAARNTAITSPQEGQFAFTKDNNSLWYYTGSAWVASGATGDIEGVTAGVGITGGGTSGTVTITNDMATTITASGDIVVGTGSGTYDNLPIGSTGQVLTADTTVSPYKVKWASASAGDTGPSFGAFIAVEQTGITANTWTKITFNSEDWDTNTNFSTANYRFTPTTAGYYQINLQAMTNGNGTFCGIYKNGTQITTSGEGAANRDVLTVKIVYMNGSSDYVEGYIYTAGSICYGAKDVTYFSGALVRTA